VNTDAFKKYGKFLWIDSIVKAYKQYTHDDVFYFEYDYAMMLLMLIKNEKDYLTNYDKISLEMRKMNSK